MLSDNIVPIFKLFIQEKLDELVREINDCDELDQQKLSEFISKSQDGICYAQPQQAPLLNTLPTVDFNIAEVNTHVDEIMPDLIRRCQAFF